MRDSVLFRRFTQSMFLILQIALVALWVRSQTSQDHLSFGKYWHNSVRDSFHSLHVGIASGSGELLFGVGSTSTAEARYIPPGSEGLNFDTLLSKEPPSIDHPSNWHSRLGFDWFHESDSVLSVSYLILPHWFLLMLSTLLLYPTLIRPWKVFIRRRQGRCLECGYDLRSISARCPECGAIFVATVKF